MPRLAVSQGKVRPEVRVDRLPGVPMTAATAPDRDAATGQWLPGNRASRRRAKALKHRGHELLLLDPDKVDEWLAPYVRGGRKHLADVLAELPDDLAANALALAEELAAARMIARGLIALGAAGDQAALREARQWLAQARLHAVALAALVGEHGATSDDDPLGWIDAAPDPADGGESKHVDHSGAGNPPGGDVSDRPTTEDDP